MTKLNFLFSVALAEVVHFPGLPISNNWVRRAIKVLGIWPKAEQFKGADLSAELY